jgi:hypothetical protein
VGCGLELETFWKAVCFRRRACLADYRLCGQDFFQEKKVKGDYSHPAAQVRDVRRVPGDEIIDRDAPGAGPSDATRETPPRP